MHLLLLVLVDALVISPSRRSAIAAAVAASLPARGAIAAPFEWTSVWQAKPAPDALPKQTGLSPSEVATILKQDLGSKKYILTGGLTPSVFRDDCRFVDPNNAVVGLAKYQQALSFLFDPAESSLEGVDVRVKDDGTISASYVASGVIKLPWRPRISPWSGTITYTLDDAGLVASQVDVWNITRWDALRQTFGLSS